MAANAVPRTSRESLNLRIRAEERTLIDRAAAMLGKTRTDFVLDAARRAAVETVTEQTLFRVDPEAFEKFEAALQRPASVNRKLSKTMQTRAPWDAD